MMFLRRAAIRLFKQSCFLKSDFTGTTTGCMLVCRLNSTAPRALSPKEARLENWQCRLDLAACYRGFERYDLHEGICNHLSMMAPAANGQGEVMLLIPYGLHWSEVKASSFLGLNEKGEVLEGTGQAEISASTIHRGVHHVRPDAVCVFHVHPPYCTALGTLKNPKLGMYHQNACLFYDRIAYDQDYTGLSLDDGEGMRIAKQLGNKSVLFMCNHGVLVVAESPARAFDDLYYLERACMTQVLAMSTGQELYELTEEVARLTYEGFDGQGQRKMSCEAHFESVKRILAKECPQYME